MFLDKFNIALFYELKYSYLLKIKDRILIFNEKMEQEVVFLTGTNMRMKYVLELYFLDSQFRALSSKVPKCVFLLLII